MGFWENWNKIRDLARRVTALEEGGGGGGLPPVTSADNGDILKVVSGAWAKAEPSGGIEIVKVWTNTNPAEITSLDVNVNLSDYDGIIVDMIYSLDIQRAVNPAIILKGTDNYIYHAGSGYNLAERYFSSVSNSGFTIGKCTLYDVNSEHSSDEPWWFVPVAAYGFKGIVIPT